ncbi:MAG: glycosyltransferase family 4 protein [Candidatus Hydrogenedentes bacterium]|nr:glycosyltransferase family 4 protein [Candidatus Hydrogenedentota bacterium]
MRILSLTPGTGGTFYCENCLRDGQMVRALRRQGHDVTVVPLYLPILLDSEGMDAEAGVFFGGVNVFLQQQLGLFRNTPRWFDRLFDSAWMLRRAAAQEGSTRAADLGPMTFSMLQGRRGRQRKELDRLLAWLSDQPKPDVAHISNALLLGVASEIRKTLNVPVVCSLQDEDTWVDAMAPAWRERCWRIIAEKGRDVDAFVSVSRWYAERIAARTQMSLERIRVVPLGIDWNEIQPAPLSVDPPVLGYLSRIHSTQGFSALVDAFIQLKKEPRLKNLRLRATGGVTSGDRDYVRDMMARLSDAGVAADVEIIEQFNKAARLEFVRSLTVLSSPAPMGEAFGLFILEAGACGVPVVQPDVGAFREVIEMTGGGLVYDPSDGAALAETLKQVLLNPDLARSLGTRAREAIGARFTSGAMAANMTVVFEECVAGRSAGNVRSAAASKGT